MEGEEGGDVEGEGLPREYKAPGWIPSTGGGGSSRKKNYGL